MSELADLLGRKARVLAACGGLATLLVEQHTPTDGLCPWCTEAYETDVPFPCEVRDLAERALYHQAAEQQRRVGARGIPLVTFRSAPGWID
ncbi:hypothetical protein [Pseudonocardia lacus]|uniref:hypothetical protein n=1 Tax=Pseudonocardia lacus TaxID=2835865 RepID=UPI001BDBDDDE|nr:hypothetical protein [Pseudonocardia lacus]